MPLRSSLSVPIHKSLDIVSSIKQVKARNVRLCILYKLLHMEANAGWKPNYM